MDQGGKRWSGNLEQLKDFPASEVKACPEFEHICCQDHQVSAVALSSNGQLNSSLLFKISVCKRHVRSNLDSVTLAADMSKTGKLTFLVDTGADISVFGDEFEDWIRPQTRKCSISCVVS
jgi:hypothetical protein